MVNPLLAYLLPLHRLKTHQERRTRALESSFGGPFGQVDSGHLLQIRGNLPGQVFGLCLFSSREPLLAITVALVRLS